MSMQGDQLARSTQRLIQMLRPENVGTAAQTAMTWFKPQPSPPSSMNPIQGFPDFPTTLGRLGALEVRLAQQKRDVKRAQKLRYRVFYRDGTAIADATTLLARRDKDAFDKICDLLLVLDHAAKPAMSGKTAGGRHLPPVAPGRGGKPWRLLYRGRVRYIRPDRSSCGFTFSRARTILRSAALPQQPHRRTAVARDLDLCPPAPARRDDRLRQLRGHRPRPAGIAAVVPASLCASPGSLARCCAFLTPRRDEPAGKGSHQSEGRAARAAASDQGISAAPPPWSRAR